MKGDCSRHISGDRGGDNILRLIISDNCVIKNDCMKKNLQVQHQKLLNEIRAIPELNTKESVPVLVDLTISDGDDDDGDYVDETECCCCYGDYPRTVNFPQRAAVVPANDARNPPREEANAFPPMRARAVNFPRAFPAPPQAPMPARVVNFPQRAAVVPANDARNPPREEANAFPPIPLQPAQGRNAPQLVQTNVAIARIPPREELARVVHFHFLEQAVDNIPEEIQARNTGCQIQ